MHIFGAMKTTAALFQENCEVPYRSDLMDVVQSAIDTIRNGRGLAAMLMRGLGAIRQFELIEEVPLYECHLREADRSNPRTPHKTVDSLIGHWLRVAHRLEQRDFDFEAAGLPDPNQHVADRW